LPRALHLFGRGACVGPASGGADRCRREGNAAAVRRGRAGGELDARADGCGLDCEPPLPADARGRLRGARPPAGRLGHLQRAGAGGGAAHVRDRHPHGPRRRRRHRRPADAAERDGIGAGGRGDRHRGRGGVDAAADVVPFRRASDRSRGVRAGDGSARRRGARCRVSAGQTRDARRSAAGAARAIKAEAAMNDVRYALRSFARRPSFAVAAIATLALGIAVNTIAFSLINSLLLRPIPVPAAGRVVRVYPVDPHGRRQNILSSADYVDYRNAATAFETLAGYVPAEMTTGRSSLDRGLVEPRAAVGYVVAANYFDLTGVRPALGRVLQPGDERSDGRVAVLSDAFWQSRLAGNPAAIGSTIALNGTAFTIVGVAAPGFAGTEPL